MSATKPVRPALHCALPVPPQQQHVPVTSPGNLQSALEFWVKPPPTETTPLVVRLPPPVVLPVTCPVSVPDDDDVTEGKESACAVACQVFVPFMVGGFGTVAAGLLLDIVQNWTVFQEVPEMFVLVPALLGLKGNLEMTLASRISTLANMGSIDSAREQWKMALGNLSLLQCQSLVLGLLASLLASGVGWAREGRFNADAALLLCLSALATAAAASLLLGSLTIAVVVACRRWRWDPDNVAAPMSASMGDVVTLALLALLASRLHAARLLWLEATAAAALLCLIPAWAVAAHRNPYTRHVLRVGWLPIVSAVAISSGGGYILNFAVARFKDIAACQPVINGTLPNNFLFRKSYAVWKSIQHLFRCWPVHYHIIPSIGTFVERMVCSHSRSAFSRRGNFPTLARIRDCITPASLAVEITCRFFKIVKRVLFFASNLLAISDFKTFFINFS